MLPNIIDKDTKCPITARRVYQELGLNNTHWKRWYQKNVVNNPFALDGIDYEGFATMASGNETQDFVITPEFAVKLCMLSRTPKGEFIRNKYINIVKGIKDSTPIKEFTTRELLELALKAEDEKEQALIELAQANKTIEIQAPKIEYVNKVLASESTFTTTTIAKELGMSAADLNRRLKEMHIQYFVDGHWVLTAKYQNLGYTKTRTHTFYNSENVMCTQISMVWSEVGRKFLHNLLNPELQKAS